MFKDGSSPRMRGTVSCEVEPIEFHRFIPAHAGNSWQSNRAIASRTVHPRACGEQKLWGRHAGLTRGSSPRMRGTETLGSPCWTYPRFIPAHAGNREEILLNALLGSVHPRACGEQLCRRRMGVISPGSSPRMRGTDHRRKSNNASNRFIPAHAGNSIVPLDSGGSTPVHPRACGEQAFGRFRSFMGTGSSPRMRGTAAHAPGRSAARRFIPAHAGNRTPCAPLRCSKTVHPRACGEQS